VVFVFEAVEAVALYEEAAAVDDGHYPATDWNRNSYAAFGAAL
jgi:hypothetical protein